MYQKAYTSQQHFLNFELPFGGKMREDNRWVILSNHIPWEEVEKKYEEHFCQDQHGAPAKSARIALGALIIKERLGTSDRETVEQIRENPYLQYFLGNQEYQDEEPFHHSMMTHFRKRFSQDCLLEINELIVDNATKGDISETEDEMKGDEDQDASEEEMSNEDLQDVKKEGKLIIDATCTPADITFPTDLKLLNDAREKLEESIDVIHEHYGGEERKPRTYREKARKEYLGISKMRRPGKKKIRKAIGKQLRYVRRDLAYIETMSKRGELRYLSKRQYRNLIVIGELYRQQLWMYTNRSHQIPSRIVSIMQPHVRPIVRGKAGHPVEFGAKISVSLVDGYGFVDRIGWDPYNESTDLIDQIEGYRQRTGHYPESVHADKIYRTQENRNYCKARNIRLSGPPLGRGRKMTQKNAEELKQEKRRRRQDEIDRIEIEGKFGQGKRRFTLARIMAKLAITSETVIMVSFMVMNLEKILSRVLFLLFASWHVTLIDLPACLACARMDFRRATRRVFDFGWDVQLRSKYVKIAC